MKSCEKNDEINIDVIMDKKIFFEFAVFDNLIRQRRWALPVKFSGIFLLFAVVCFFMSGTHEQAVMLGCVLLAVGFGLPLFYFLVFFNSIRQQIKVLGLKEPKAVYSLKLTEDENGISVKNFAGEQAGYEWSRLHGVYQNKGCTYLYVLSNRAFLLPHEQVEEGPEALKIFLDGIKNRETNL